MLILMVSKSGRTLQERITRKPKPKVIEQIPAIEYLKRAILVNSETSVKNYVNIHLKTNPGNTAYERYTQPTKENVLKHFKYAVRNPRCKFIVVFLNDLKMETISFYKILKDVSKHIPNEIVIVSKCRMEPCKNITIVLSDSLNDCSPR